MQHQLYNLDDLGLLRVSGQDAEKLLQGQLSCDMTSVTTHGGTMGVHCNPQGRIISLFYVVRIDNGFLLIMPRSLITTALNALKKYAVFFKTELLDVSGTLTLTGSTAALQASDATISLPNSTRKIYLSQHRAETRQGHLEDWRLLDMQEGLPWIYPETSGKFLPHDLNLPELKAVSFTKGCYTGQEIIARMQYRGKPKKHLYRGISTTAPAPGALLYARNEPSRDAGEVIDSCKQPFQERYLLLFTTDESTALNQPLMTVDGSPVDVFTNEFDKSESP